MQRPVSPGYRVHLGTSEDQFFLVVDYREWRRGLRGSSIGGGQCSSVVGRGGERCYAVGEGLGVKQTGGGGAVTSEEGWGWHVGCVGQLYHAGVKVTTALLRESAS